MKDQKDMIYFSKSEFSNIKGDKGWVRGLLSNSPHPKLRSEGKMNHLELIRLEQQRDAKILRQIFLSVLVSDDLALQPHSSEKPWRSANPWGVIPQGLSFPGLCQDCSDGSISKVLSISHFSSAGALNAIQPRLNGWDDQCVRTTWLRNKILLLALESSSENDDLFSSTCQEKRQSSGEELRSPILKELLGSTRKEWDSGVRGATGKGEELAGGSCFLVTLQETGPLWGESMGNWAQESWSSSPQLGSQEKVLVAALTQRSGYHEASSCPLLYELHGLVLDCAISGHLYDTKIWVWASLNWISSHLCLSGLPTCN